MAALDQVPDAALSERDQGELGGREETVQDNQTNDQKYVK
jgi:hypothetical protein